MLKELFEAHFYGTFPRVDDRALMIDERFYVGDFFLRDDSACRGCRFVCSEDPLGRAQLKVHSTQEVCVISIAQIFSYVSESVGETCDYMLESNSTAALVEMTCSNEDYVKDKRLKARGQLYNTLQLLCTNPVVREHLARKGNRFAIFSWRETFPPEARMDSVESSMIAMTQMVDEVYSPDNESKFDFGFKLREIRYPFVLSFT